MFEVGLGVALFVAIVMIMAMMIVFIRSKLVPSGVVNVTVNESTKIDSPTGVRLLAALGDAGIHLPSACSGIGTCGLCKVEVLEGGGAPLPVEMARMPRLELAAGSRLACQVVLRENMNIRVPEDILGVQQWRCTVRSNESVGTFIKELVLVLPSGEALSFLAGAFIQVTCPPCQIAFTDFDIAPEFRDAWNKLDLWRFEVISAEPQMRAYSMANYPDEKGIIILNIRIALPPPGVPESVPPGIVSSYLFNLKPGDELTISGPYGHFFAAESEKEMIFVGGGVGMAPMRAHILDQLKRIGSQRKITFWYGARSRRELFYTEEFDRLQEEHANFEWFAALSEPLPEDRWKGHIGFIHQVLHDAYLKDHPDPEDCEYYVCGPPMMIQAVIKMLDDLGVGTESILYDDFGV
jgi:Na+-transporting NADH:ubiquinone oxidoreductase subunit F